MVQNETYEHTLPVWQRWTNGFLENWIFAFIVAMVVRQFFLEPFVIPTASMEPMLLGSQYMSKADHVVVNKFTHRFTPAERWDVTVFEFPIPEIYHKQEKRENQIWGLGDKEPVAHWLSQPLQHRNFVKRLVILPGDEFFISGGDIYVKNGETFEVARKPAAIQAALWQCMYEHGAEANYKPWSVGSDIIEGKLVLKPGQRAITFTQPLNNLYMKPGVYRVHPRQDSSDSIEVELSMLKPSFQLKNRQGNAWDLEHWAIYRLNKLEIDNEQEHGTMLNRRMQEMIGDVRVRFKPESVNGVMRLEFFDRDRNQYVLQLDDKSWKLAKVQADTEAELASGAESVVGQDCVFVRIDNQIWFEINGKELHSRIECERPQNPDQGCIVRWAGAGQMVLSECALDRDVHYCRSGFLADLGKEQQEAAREAAVLQDLLKRRQLLVAGEDPSLNGLKTAVTDAQSYYAGLLSSQSVHELIRERLLGRPLANDTERLRPLGDGPNNSITAPENAYLLFGDNSPFSWDSRNWGWVPDTNIRGRAAWVVFPVSRWKSIR